MSSIQFSPFTSIFENKPAGTIIIGVPGSGKTYFILNIIANALLMKNRIFALDYKNDLQILKNLDIAYELNYIDINNIKPGALNPFAVIKNIDVNTIQSIISIMCGGLTDDQQIILTPIIQDHVNEFRRMGGNMSFNRLANYLYDLDALNPDDRTMLSNIFLVMLFVVNF